MWPKCRLLLALLVLAAWGSAAGQGNCAAGTGVLNAGATRCCDKNCGQCDTATCTTLPGGERKCCGATFTAVCKKGTPAPCRMPSPSGPFGPACTTDQECQGSAGAKAVCYRGKCTCSYYQTHAYVDGQCIARTAICSAAAGLSATGSRQHCSKPNLAYVLDGAMSIQDPKLACDPVTFSCTCRPGYKWWTPDPAQKYEGRCIEEKRMCSATSFCATANGQEVSCVGGQCACDAAGYMWSAVTSSSSATNVTGMRYGTCSKPPIIYDQPSTVCPAPKVYAAFPANTNTGVYTDWGMCVGE
eukprot:TRINITY_DN1535_c0_g1_i3.p1 TRINITY_DN1535_c0_g1~~TRINITY_DN1535_c0_g1_i3.p1  ORF type:complete len:300 (+),score=41.43 TRINITY_DN1535_c0_g1_i3:229-1128(+)